MTELNNCAIVYNYITIVYNRTVLLYKQCKSSDTSV